MSAQGGNKRRTGRADCGAFSTSLAHTKWETIVAGDASIVSRGSFSAGGGGGGGGVFDDELPLRRRRLPMVFSVGVRVGLRVGATLVGRAVGAFVHRPHVAAQFFLTPVATDPVCVQ